MRLRNVLLLDLVVLAACVPGILNVVAKDQVSTAEGVVAWISAVGFVVALLALLVLGVFGVLRLFRRTPSRRA
jgi:threonine/homoserine/homoserine lactone efflux protein